jgi:hypothetical protein
MTRLHIVGCPRSGTTLAFQALVSTFVVLRHFPEECRITQTFDLPDVPGGVCCSKFPGDILLARSMLAREPDLHLLYLLRDPRDVIVSRHRRAPDRYWTNLRIWRAAERAARSLAGHARFVTLRYEMLVREPGAAQHYLMEALPFLRPRGLLAAFHETARPSVQSEEALGGLRPLSGDRVGSWRDDKPRVVGQMARHGSLVADLIARGYESDGAWTRELEGVAPDGRPSALPESGLAPWTLYQGSRRWGAFLRYLLRQRGRHRRPSSRRGA